MSDTDEVVIPLDGDPEPETMDSPGTASDSDTATDHSAKTDELEEINRGVSEISVAKEPQSEVELTPTTPNEEVQDDVAVPLGQVSAESAVNINATLTKNFLTGFTLPVVFRKDQLKALLLLFKENKEDIIKAVRTDLGKGNAFEATITEWNMVVTAIKEAIDHVKKWASTQTKYTPMSAKPASAYVRHEPKGAVLIMSPWNYPVNLAIVPLVGAIAAGCTICLKMSPYSANASALMKTLLEKYLDNRMVCVEFEGGRNVIQALLQPKWDHIFFTGSVHVGREVYKAAAAHLTPVTLELGGKNPVYVDQKIDIKTTARRLIWSKMFNTGQTCLAPDHIYCHEAVYDDLLTALVDAIKEMYNKPLESEDYGRMISSRQTQRVERMISDPFVKVFSGGTVDVDNKYIAPTILVDVTEASQCMQEEIFGPVLPVIKIQSKEAACRAMRDKPTPLALYIFTKDKKVVEFVASQRSSGTMAVNDAIAQFGVGDLPFGGCGESGLGYYHEGGLGSFLAFTHRRPVLHNSLAQWSDLSIRYPPHTSRKTSIASTLTNTSW